MLRQHSRSVVAVAEVGLVLLLVVGCNNDVSGPQTGAARVAIATANADLAPHGYIVSVDGGAPLAAPVNGSATIPGLKTGSHSVALGGLGNCVVSGANPRSVNVVAGDTAQLAFAVDCTAITTTGNVSVTVTTTGVALDADGYYVVVDDTAVQAIAVNGTVTFRGVVAGSRRVGLHGVAVNCGYAGPNPQSVGVVGSGTATVSFAVSCGPVTQIAFVSSANNGYNIYLMNTDGSGLVRLTTFPAYQPAWSADGTKIAFTTARCCGSIYVMNADGTGLVRLTNTFADGDPAWSPDGKKIAFDRFLGNGETEIYVMNADGTGVTQLTSTPGGESDHPSWSPDGSRITFASYREGNSHIYVMKADGSGVVRLTSDPTHSDVGPTWSPDGSKIAFVKGFNIYVMNADGSSQTNLYARSDPNEGGLSWSPDGAKIAFGLGACDDSGCYIDIGVVNADGTDLNEGITNNHTSLQPAWRPRIP